MTTILSPLENTASNIDHIAVEWKPPESPAPHEFVAILCPEDEGGFSVFAERYPGIISQGDNRDEAEANIAEAFLAMLEAKRKHGEGLEFSHEPMLEVPANCIRLRIRVDG